MYLWTCLVISSVERIGTRRQRKAIMSLFSMRAVAIIFATIILSGCGRQLIVLATDRYTPQDEIEGPIPGDPNGDSIDFGGTRCHDTRITFFPTTLIAPGTALSIVPGCDLFIRCVDHDPDRAHDTYRVSWLGQGEATIIPIFESAVDNSVSALETTEDGVRYLAPGAESRTLALLDGFGAAHRIAFHVSPAGGSINVRAETFNEHTPLNDAKEFTVVAPQVAGKRILSGLRFEVSSSAGVPYFLSDLYVTLDRE